MYAAIRQVKAKPGLEEGIIEQVKGAVDIVSAVPGFMGYYVIHAPDDTVTAISIFNTAEQANESNERALAWIEQHMAPYVIGEATATAGPVIVHALP
ncbi:MAG: antibiotic biosynthesis monooxygenase [Roseiarcus sp.]